MAHILCIERSYITVDATLSQLLMYGLWRILNIKTQLVSHSGCLNRARTYSVHGIYTAHRARSYITIDTGLSQCCRWCIASGVYTILKPNSSVTLNAQTEHYVHADLTDIAYVLRIERSYITVDAALSGSVLLMYGLWRIILCLAPHDGGWRTSPIAIHRSE